MTPETREALQAFADHPTLENMQKVKGLFTRYTDSNPYPLESSHEYHVKMDCYSDEVRSCKCYTPSPCRYIHLCREFYVALYRDTAIAEFHLLVVQVLIEG